MSSYFLRKNISNYMYVVCLLILKFGTFSVKQSCSRKKTKKQHLTIYESKDPHQPRHQ